MSLPKSKMLSASKSIMAIATVKRDIQKQNQKQVVNVNVNPPPQPQVNVVYPKPYEIDEGITVIPATITTQAQPTETQPQTQPDTQTRDIKQIEELEALLNNSENVARALIMIIDIMQSNPLIINKLIVSYEQPFRSLVQTLTNADDVDVQFVEDVGCFTSKKYKIIDDVYVIKAGETQSLKYGYPEVIRLFDRFNISTKMIACDS
ncbi:MAG: hypothetical protein IKO56_06345 [Alphaproteobacteria bacterium]|nr:hypothetical protein [Alphaproteobacteria bacterium]